MAIEIILNDRLKAATSERAILQSGAEISCKTLISTVPSALPPVVQNLDCPKERGKLLVNTGLELKDYEGKVWALGDCAAITTIAGTKVPPTAQHAIREATTAAINIAAAVRGGRRAKFEFEGLGTLGSLGHGAAVAQIFGVKLSGFHAWLLWRCIYLMKMPGLNRKVRIATDWLLHLCFRPSWRRPRSLLNPASEISISSPAISSSSRATWVTACMSSRKATAKLFASRTAKQELLATLDRGEYFGEMALLSDRTRNATIRACTAMDVLIIPKADFNKLRQSVPAFGNVFTELVKRREAP